MTQNMKESHNFRAKNLKPPATGATVYLLLIRTL